MSRVLRVSRSDYYPWRKRIPPKRAQYKSGRGGRVRLSRLSLFKFTEGRYNPDRLYSDVGYQSPQRYEEEYHPRHQSQSEESRSPGAA